MASQVVVLTGRTLGGEYAIGERLGVGGFGAVYRARQHNLDRDVAVKVLHHRARNPRRPAVDPANRLRREVQSLVRVNHDNVVKVYATGIEHDGTMWIAMPLLEGVTLRAFLEKQGAMSLAQFVPIFEQIAKAVQSAHKRNVVHRDLKPDNIMLVKSDDGPLVPMLLDFGIAKWIADVEQEVEVSSMDVEVMPDDFDAQPATQRPAHLGPAAPRRPGSGTRSHMAPELFKGRENVGTMRWGKHQNCFRDVPRNHDGPARRRGACGPAAGRVARDSGVHQAGDARWRELVRDPQQASGAIAAGGRLIAERGASAEHNEVVRAVAEDGTVQWTRALGDGHHRAAQRVISRARRPGRRHRGTRAEWPRCSDRVRTRRSDRSMTAPRAGGEQGWRDVRRRRRPRRFACRRMLHQVSPHHHVTSHPMSGIRPVRRALIFLFTGFMTACGGVSERPPADGPVRDRDGSVGDSAVSDGSMSSQLGTEANPARTCAQLKVAGMPSGAYWVRHTALQDPPFRVYCEQDFNGGGWAMLENSVRRDDGSTTTFWQFKYDDRLRELGTLAPDQNYYNGALYKIGTEYMDVFTDLAGKTVGAAVMTATGINPTTMQFMQPTLIIGNAVVFGGQFASGWSAKDRDGDGYAPDNCSTLYASVAQHYSGCWAYNLGADADDDKFDGGVGPHVENSVLTTLGLMLQPAGGAYSQVKRIARFTHW